MGVPVVLGGMHPTMMSTEAKTHADAVVLGEAEEIWPQVLYDFKRGNLKSFYKPAKVCSLDGLLIPKRDLLNRKAYFLSIPFRQPAAALLTVISVQLRHFMVDLIARGR